MSARARYRGASISSRCVSRWSSSCCVTIGRPLRSRHRRGARPRAARPREFRSSHKSRTSRTSRRVRPIRLAGLVGFLDDPMRVVTRMLRVPGALPDDRRSTGVVGDLAPVEKKPAPERTKVDDVVVAVEREVLKDRPATSLRWPDRSSTPWTSDNFLSRPSPQAGPLRNRARQAGPKCGTAVPGRAWTSAKIEAPTCVDDRARIRHGIHALSRPAVADRLAVSQERYVGVMLARLHEIVTSARQVALLKSKPPTHELGRARRTSYGKPVRRVDRAGSVEPELPRPLRSSDS